MYFDDGIRHVHARRFGDSFQSGDEFTSMIMGPFFDSSMSTPATRRPKGASGGQSGFAIFGRSLISVALPPRCRFERNSPPLA